MKQAKTYTVANKEMTLREIETATGISLGKIRIQLNLKGIKDIQKAVENASSPEQAKAVKKLFRVIKAKTTAKKVKANASKSPYSFKDCILVTNPKVSEDEIIKKASVKPSERVKVESIKAHEERVTVDIMAGTYTIVRRAEDTENYQKGTIEVFKGKRANPRCAITGSVIKFLKEVIDEKHLSVKLRHSKRSSVNTRQLGKDLIHALV